MKLGLSNTAALYLAGIFLTAPSLFAVETLGTGTGVLIGGDLTDPENDGTDAGANYNATFFASHEAGFEGSENAFNVFDNKVNGGEDKWCCNGASVEEPVWVAADFGDDHYILTGFTLANQDATPDREPDIWAIQGSNDSTDGADGIWTDIFTYSVDGTSPFTAVDGDNDQNEVISYVTGADFPAPAAFSKFRFFATSDTGTVQLAEIEFFGTLAIIDTDMDGMGDLWEQAAIDSDPDDVIDSLDDIKPNENLDGDTLTAPPPTPPDRRPGRRGQKSNFLAMIGGVNSGDVFATAGCFGEARRPGYSPSLVESSVCD